MYQNIVLVGNLGRDPEMRYTPGGQAVCNFSMATNRQYTDSNGETVKETTWFRISTWGKLAEVCNTYLKQGKLVLVEGRLNADKETGSPRIYTKNDGSTGSSFEVTAQTVKFLSPRDEGSEAVYASGEDSEDIPF